MQQSLIFHFVCNQNVSFDVSDYAVDITFDFKSRNLSILYGFRGDNFFDSPCRSNIQLCEYTANENDNNNDQRYVL